MGRPIKLTQSSTQDTGYASQIGGTIGAPYATSGVYTIDFQYVDNSGNTHAHGWSYKQRNKHRFDVSDSSTFSANTTVYLRNTDLGNLTAGQASVICYNTSGTQFYAKELEAHWVVDWAGNRYPYDIQTPATATLANVATN